MGHTWGQSFLGDFIELYPQKVQIKVGPLITFSLFNIVICHRFVLFLYFFTIKSCWILLSHMSCFFFIFLVSRSKFGTNPLLFSFWFRKSCKLGCFHVYYNGNGEHQLEQQLNNDNGKDNQTPCSS
jgi:hypothetical protein